MVDDGCAQGASDDGQGSLESRCKNEREELSLIADFSEGDDSGRNEERFHNGSKAGLQTVDHHATPANSEALWSKVSPCVETAYAMTCGSSVLT